MGRSLTAGMEENLDDVAQGERDTTKASVVMGISRTGKLVTSAALILFLAFTALSNVPLTDVRVFATALAAGIIIDATVVRGLLTPALVTLFGRANWWFPRPLGRLLVSPGQASGPPHSPASAVDSPTMADQAGKEPAASSAGPVEARH